MLLCPTERHMLARTDIHLTGRESRSLATHLSFFFRPGTRSARDTSDDHRPIDPEGPARWETEPVSPKKRLLATWTGRIFVALVAAAVIIGG
ncbi:MAG TPA: hypothetical protein VNA10_05555, partial [Thermoplasmata archaeon]|nr:hypothetical protein [Thermoplasmata archaeon]